MDVETKVLLIFFGVLIGLVTIMVHWIKDKLDESEFNRGYAEARNDTLQAFSKRGLTELYVDVTGDKVIKITGISRDKGNE